MDLKFLLDLEAGPLSQVFGILPLMFWMILIFVLLKSGLRLSIVT